MDNLGYIDLVFLGIIIVVAIRGFFSGFIKELFSMLGLVLGVVFASRFAYEGGQWFKTKIFYLDSDTLSTLIGFSVIFLVIWIASYILSELVFRLTKTAFPKYLNGLLGFFFGALKSYLALAILLHFVFRLEFMHTVMSHFGQNSVFYSGMESIASKIVKADIISRLPKDSKELKEKLNEVQENIVEEIKEIPNEAKEALQSEQKTQQ